MLGKYRMKLSTVVDDNDLVLVYKATDYDTVEVANVNISRPALPFVGFYDCFDPDRIQIMGRAEDAYLHTLEEARREEIIDKLFSQHFPMLIVAHRVVPDVQLVEAARKHNVTLATTDMDTSDFVAQVTYTLRTYLADRVTAHGVLVQVHGEGLLIQGESGIGKSEVGLELIKRGHRLVADDAVELRKMGRSRLTGTAPEMIRHLMELRGVGLIDVRRIYGAGAVLPTCDVDLVVNFVHWREGVEYDRLGLVEETTSFVGVKVPQITVPVAPGRNLAIILEVAAINNREKKMGYNTAREFLARHDAGIDSGVGF